MHTYGNSLIRKDGETPLFDGLGSERTVTNSSQSVTASLTLSAFGQTVASTGSSSSPYQFGATSGYRTEGDAGLTLVRCRFYDAQVGRFITRDTHLDQAPYAYCDADPVNRLDPSGHNWGLLLLILIVIVILLIEGPRIFSGHPIQGSGGSPAGNNPFGPGPGGTYGGSPVPGGSAPGGSGSPTRGNSPGEIDGSPVGVGLKPGPGYSGQGGIPTDR